MCLIMNLYNPLYRLCTMDGKRIWQPSHSCSRNHPGKPPCRRQSFTNSRDRPRSSERLDRQHKHRPTEDRHREQRHSRRDSHDRRRQSRSPPADRRHYSTHGTSQHRPDRPDHHYRQPRHQTKAIRQKQPRTRTPSPDTIKGYKILLLNIWKSTYEHLLQGNKPVNNLTIIKYDNLKAPLTTTEEEEGVTVHSSHFQLRIIDRTIQVLATVLHFSVLAQILHAQEGVQTMIENIASTSWKRLSAPEKDSSHSSHKGQKRSADNSQTHSPARKNNRENSPSSPKPHKILRRQEASTSLSSRKPESSNKHNWRSARPTSSSPTPSTNSKQRRTRSLEHRNTCTTSRPTSPSSRSQPTNAGQHSNSVFNRLGSKTKA